MVYHKRVEAGAVNGKRRSILILPITYSREGRGRSWGSGRVGGGFSFSARVTRTRTVGSGPGGRSLRRRGRLFSVGMRRLTGLGGGIFGLEARIRGLSNSVQRYGPVVSSRVRGLTIRFKTELLYSFLDRVRDGYGRTRQEVGGSNGAVLIPIATFCVAVVVLMTLSSFFTDVVMTGIRVLRSDLV